MRRKLISLILVLLLLLLSTFTSAGCQEPEHQAQKKLEGNNGGESPSLIEKNMDQSIEKMIEEIIVSESRFHQPGVGYNEASAGSGFC